MPMHDWTRVEPGIYHDFHHEWISAIKHVLNGLLEPMAVGEPLPDMPVFLNPGYYVNVPLEQSYLSAWSAVPKRGQSVIADQQGVS